MQRQQEPYFVALYRYLLRTLKEHKLATFTNTLLRDALTTALGVKAATLLDFHLPPPVLEQVFQRIHATDAQLFAALALLTLTTADDSAVFMLHRPSFLSHSQPLHSTVPLVDISPALPRPQLLHNDTASVVTDQLHSFASLLSAALKADTAVSHLTLHSPPHLCLPTLCGWLLGYPVPYTFPSSPVVPSTNCLSNQPLTVFTISLHPTANLSPGFASESGSVMLQSFSVPTALLSQPVVIAAVQAWERRIYEKCSIETVRPWIQQLSISKTAVCLPHVSL